MELGLTNIISGILKHVSHIFESLRSFQYKKSILGGNNWVGLESGSVHRGVKFWLTVCSSTSDGRRGVHERWYHFAHLLSLNAFLRVQSCSIPQNIYNMTRHRAQASHASQASRLLHVRHPLIYTTMIQIQKLHCSD